MNLETVDVTQLRALVARNEDYLRTHPDTQQVRGRTMSVAASITGDHSPLVQKARELPPAQSLVAPRGVSSPLARDDRFDAAVEELIAAFYLTIDQIEDFQHRLKANETVSDDAVVDAVLAEVAKNDDQPQWNSPLSWTLGISDLRTRDALEELAQQGAIKINDRSRTGVDDFLFTVTAHGRRLARGTVKPRASVPLIQLTQHISDSIIASAGVSHGDVEQHVTINPDVRDMVYALTQFEAAIGRGPDTIAAVTLAQGASRELRANGWGESAISFLRAIPGTLSGATALAANAKPAYDLVRTLAAAHGIAWPALP